jgi:hypothetical protein
MNSLIHLQKWSEKTNLPLHHGEQKQGEIILEPEQAITGHWLT